MKTKVLLFSAISLIFLAFSFTMKYKSPIKLSKQINKSFSFIPAGTTIINNTSFSVNYFYMSKTEISNSQYNEFLNDLKANNELEKLKIAAIDTSNWVTEFGKFGESYAIYYHNHGAYANFPVVNISKAGAELYCVWLAQKLNTENEGLQFTVRLPIEAEWLRACNPNNTSFPYSWQTSYLRGGEGQFMCNFRRIGEGNIHYDSITKSFQLKDVIYPLSESLSPDVTTHVNSYHPTTLGLYNLNGNVAEFTVDGFAMGGSWRSAGYDVRNESKLKTTSPSTEVGFRPVFSVKEK